MTSDFVKENIVLKNQCEDYIFNFKYVLKNLEARLEDNGVVSLYDNKSGEIVYEIPAPYMYDSNGVISYDVQYELDRLDNGEYELKIVANEQWINAEERVFPVVIDPTIRTTPVVFDTYTNSTSPNTNYGYDETLWISSARTSYIKIGVLPSIPDEAIINSAQLYTAFYYYDSVKTGCVAVGAYQVTSSWGEGQLTWNKAKTLTNYGYATSMLSLRTLSATVGATKNSPAWANFDITSAVKSWYNGSSKNYGIALKYIGGSNASVIIKAHESEKQNRAYITISYAIEEEQVIADGVYWFSSKATAGVSGNRRVMDVTGNSSKINTEIQQWDSDSPSIDKYRAQLFYVKYIGAGYYRIYTFSNPNYCLKKVGTKIYTGVEDSSSTMWKITGNKSSGYTITNYDGASYAITVPESVTNGDALVYSSKYASNNERNKWNINKFEGYVFSIVSDPGLTEDIEEGSGHAFLLIENCSSKVIDVGYIEVLPEQTVTVGTAGAVGGSGGSSSGEEFEGIFYNREAYNYHEENFYKNRYALSIPIDGDDLQIINDNYLQNDKYNDWDLWLNDSHNCSWFAMQVWNSVSNWDVDAYQGYGLGHNPWTLASSIKKYSWYVEDIDIPKYSWYGYYNSETKRFVYIVGSSGAYPNVETE